MNRLKSLKEKILSFRVNWRGRKAFENSARYLKAKARFRLRGICILFFCVNARPHRVAFAGFPKEKDKCRGGGARLELTEP